MAGQVNPLLSFDGAPTGFQGHVDPFVPPGLDTEKEVPVSQLNLKHAEYEARYDAWVDLSLLYEGGALLKTRAERVLKKRPREDEEVYAARLDRFTYQNILGTGLGWYGAALFDTAPEVFFNGESGSDFYTKFLMNCDTVGTTYVDFWKRVFQFLLTFGSAWVLTDLKALDEDEPLPVSLQDEDERGLRSPHLAAYTPLNVINWKEDNKGELKWAVVMTESEDQEFLGKKELVTTWYYYDRMGYRVYEYRRSPEEEVKIATNDNGRMAKLVREGVHALGSVSRLPIRKLMLSEGLWLANRAYLLLIDHLNQDNTLAWSLFMSNLAIPIIIGDTDTSNLTYHEAGYLHFPAGTEYSWSEPEGKSFSHSAKRVESLREECFRSMNLQAQGRSMRATPAMQSGKSKQLEMSPAKQILSGMGDDVRRFMQEVLVDVRDARREKNVEPDVRGFTFQEDMTTEEVFAVSSLLNIRVPSKKFEKYIYKKIAKSWMTDANREELTAVYKEIEAGPTMDERLQDEFKMRVQTTKANVKNALNPGDSALQLPPGRGGAGPSPNTPK